MARGSSKAAASTADASEPVSGIDQTGDGGAREEEVSQAQQAFNGLHEQLELGDEAGLVVRNATDWVVELFKHRPKAWDQLSQAEQRDLVAGIEENVHELVRQIVEAITRTGREAVRCLFVGFTDKGDDIKAELKVKAYSKEETEAAVISLHRARGKHVLVTVASADDFHDERGADRSEPDQRALAFEAGSDEHPDDDSDLVEAGGSKPGRHEPVVAGMLGETMRVNLKTGQIQVQVEGQIDDDGENAWLDVRDATPAELAAERERTADFGDAEEETEAEQVV